MKRYLLNTAFFGTSIQLLDIEEDRDVYSRIYVDCSGEKNLAITLATQRFPPPKFNGKGFKEITLVRFARILTNYTERYLPSIPPHFQDGNISFHTDENIALCVHWVKGHGHPLRMVKRNGEGFEAYRNNIQIQFNSRKQLPEEVSPAYFEKAYTRITEHFRNTLMGHVREAFS